MTSSFNNQKFNSSAFNRGTGLYAVSQSSLKWNNPSFFVGSEQFTWNADSYTEALSTLQWCNLVLTPEFSGILEWANRVYISTTDINKWGNRNYSPLITSIVQWNNRISTSVELLIFPWNEVSYSTSSSILEWDNRTFVDGSLGVPWNEVSYETALSILEWNNGMFVDASSNLPWNEVSYETALSILEWNNGMFVDASSNLLWNEVSYEAALSTLEWNNREFTDAYLSSLLWDEHIFSTSSSILEWDNISYLVSSGILNWNNVAYNTSSDILEWGNREFTGEIGSDVKWLNRMFPDVSSSLAKWGNRVFASAITDALIWNNACYNTSSNILLWSSLSLLTSSSILQWEEVSYVQSMSYSSVGSSTVGIESVFTWLNTSGEFFPLSDYLSVKTIQGRYIFPDIIGGTISFKDGSIGEATLELAQIIPEDSRCIFYLKGDARMFDGISRRCVKDPSGTYKVTIQEYNEILKPENGKGGLYLVKNEWHDVELHNLLSSEKPTLNDNEMGLLYMARSAIPDHLFEEYDAVNNIFKFEYTGIPYSITEVFEDVALLTPKTSAAALVSASGWYHDVANKVLYVRCTDSVFPYYHVISVPYIWDFKVPIRIGNISSQSTTVIAYWETANGDIPLETIENLLTALDLEYEPVYRNGVCRIDVSAKIGSGSTTSPANYYNEEDNIIAVQEIDMADARNMINTVLIDAYGSGAGRVKSGKHINMGRGGRFILLDDSSIHSQEIADGFVEKYLSDHYLPARSIKFSAPLFVGDAVDQRRLGDTAHISIPSEYLEQDLRIKEIAIKLKPLSQTLTFGDKLISYDDQMKAMRSASEKYRKHLQGEIEEFTWSWNENLDNGANKSNKFTITADALKVQKLELSCSTSLFRTDAIQGAGGGGGGGAGDDSGGGAPGEKPHTGPGDAHTHTLTSGAVGVPSATISVAAKDHYHVLNSLVSSTPSSWVMVAAKDHYHVLNSLLSSVPSATVAVAASTHYHVLSSVLSAVPSATVSVPTYDHAHQFTVTSAATIAGSITNVASSSHTHAVTSSSVATASFTSVAQGTHTHAITSSSAATAAGSITNVASSSHTHAITSSLVATDSFTSVALGTHIHTITSSSAATAAGSITNVASSSHTHAVTSSSVATASWTSVTLGTHTHTIENYCDPSASGYNQDVASYMHTHTINSSSLATTATPTSVALAAHTHTFDETAPAFGGSNVSINGVGTIGYACCTGVNCGSQFVTSVGLNERTFNPSSHTHGVSGTVAVTGSYGNVASSSHTHTINSSSLQTGSFTNVALATHIHAVHISSLATGSSFATNVASSSHTHATTSSLVATDSFTSVALGTHTHAITSSSAATAAGSITNVASSSHTHAITSSLVATDSFTSVALGTHIHTITSSSAATVAGSITNVASSSHTHAVTSSSVATTSFTSVALGTHTHTVSGTAVATGTITSVSTSTHTHTTSGDTNACTASTTVSTSTHTHTTSGNTNACTTPTTVATFDHTHTTSGNTNVCNAQTTVSTSTHTHTITALVLASEATHTHEISSDGYNPTLATSPDAEVCVNDVTKEPETDYQTNAGSRNTAADHYTLFSPPSYPAHSPIDPTMRFKVSISGPGIAVSTEIVGSPFVIHIDDSFGPALIDNLVKVAGEYTVIVDLANVDYPADKTHLNFSMQIQGQVFVDTIVKS